MIPSKIAFIDRVNDLPDRAINAEAIAKITGGYYNKHRNWIEITDSFNFS